MQNLDPSVEQIRQTFDARTAARDRALADARSLTRHCANAIRAVHRDDEPGMNEHLGEARTLAASLRSSLVKFPELYYAGYTQDALKEFAEASITCALIRSQPLLSPDELGVEHNTYLNGLAEVVGELRRRCLDILRHGYSAEAERLLTAMDDIYAVLVTMDYPDAITNGLALSRNAHWMFDEGLWSVRGDGRVVLAPQRFTENGPEGLRLQPYAGRLLQFADEALLITLLRRDAI